MIYTKTCYNLIMVKINPKVTKAIRKIDNQKINTNINKPNYY